MTMQGVAPPALAFTPPKRNSLTHIPGDEGWPIIGKTLDVLSDPKGHIEHSAAKYGLVYRSHLFGETSLVLLGPEANELVLFDQAKQFSSSHGWGQILGRLWHVGSESVPKNTRRCAFGRARPAPSWCRAAVNGSPRSRRRPYPQRLS